MIRCYRSCNTYLMLILMSSLSKKPPYTSFVSSKRYLLAVWFWSVVDWIETAPIFIFLGAIAAGGSWWNIHREEEVKRRRRGGGVKISKWDKKSLHIRSAYFLCSAMLQQPWDDDETIFSPSLFFVSWVWYPLSQEGMLCSGDGVYKCFSSHTHIILLYTYVLRTRESFQIFFSQYTCSIISYGKPCTDFWSTYAPPPYSVMYMTSQIESHGFP